MPWLSLLLAALLALSAGLWLAPSAGSRIAAAMTSLRPLPMPAVRGYVPREETEAIISAVAEGGEYVIVEGGHASGKSVAVQAAAAALSHSRAVLWYNCTVDSTMASVLVGLYSLDHPWLLERLAAAVLQGAPASVPSLVLRMGALTPEPVLVVEMAELLALEELGRLLHFARQLVDARLGRFILVFSSSASLGLLAGAGALSRAQAIPVLDLTRQQAALYLAGGLAHTGSAPCPAPRAATVYSLLGGHLPHLRDRAVALYCAGALSQAALASHFAARVAAKFQAVEVGLACNAGACACAVACAIDNEQWGHALLGAAQGLLLAQHLTQVTMLQQVPAWSSPFVRSHVQQRCACSQQLAGAQQCEAAQLAAATGEP